MSIYHCPECGFRYDEEQGVPREGFAPGTLFGDVPDDWTCPDCGVRDKLDFVEGATGAPLSQWDGAPDEAGNA